MSNEMSDFQGWPIAEATRRVPGLQHHLANGRLLGWGRPGNPNHAAAPIPASSWSGKIELSKFLTSNKPDAICDEKSFFDVSVFPVLLAPNAIEHLGFLSLKDVFSRFVIGDPEVQYLGNIACAAVPQFLAIYREGRCYSGYYWPLNMEGLLSLGETDPQAEEYFGYCSTVETELAQRALRNRYQALLNLLCSRRLLAEGDPVRPNDPQQILSSIWASPSYYFDSRTGDILEERNWGDEEVETFRFDDGRENYLVRWRAVLIGPGAGRVEQVNEAKTEQRGSKKRGKLTPTEKSECCVEFLKTQMKLNPLKPKAKALVCLDARQHCRANISWPMFKDAWATAKDAVPEAALNWEKSGRPKKSGQK
jgi:hypothetical protein